MPPCICIIGGARPGFSGSLPRLSTRAWAPHRGPAPRCVQPRPRTRPLRPRWLRRYRCHPRGRLRRRAGESSSRRLVSFRFCAYTGLCCEDMGRSSMGGGWPDIPRGRSPIDVRDRYWLRALRASLRNRPWRRASCGGKPRCWHLRLRVQPNQRMKLSWRGGRLKGNGSLLIAAAAPRSLCAIR